MPPTTTFGVATLLVVIVARSTLCAVGATNPTDTTIRFLRAYGFLDDIQDSLPSSSSSPDNATTLRHALSLFQDYYQLSGNGTLTAETLRLMQRPRCGVRDVPEHAFSPKVRKWQKTHLTWNFYEANKDMLRTATAAFAIWAANSSLTFTRDTLRPDILISFRTGTHTYATNSANTDVCPVQLDGPGGILAHAFYPTGQPNHVAEIHMDEAEPWYIFMAKNPPHTHHLQHTLTHEIGHALGLRHSLRRDSIMFAFATDGDRDFPVTLSIEDILAIQNLYGATRGADVSTPRPATTTVAPITTTSTPTTTTTHAAPKEPASVDLCALRHIDGALIMNHRLYVMHRRNLWSISMVDRRYGKPISLTDYMHFLPRNFTRLTAAYQRPSGDLALFVDSSLYVLAYPALTLKHGYPQSIAHLGLPAKARINAALNTHTGRTYVIYNDDKVAEIDECGMTAVTHVALGSVFPGIPSAITFAFRHADGNLYFFTKQQFYAFNEFTNTVLVAGPFDLYVLGIECPSKGLLRQLRELLERLYHLGHTSANIEEEEDAETEA